MKKIILIAIALAVAAACIAVVAAALPGESVDENGIESVGVPAEQPEDVSKPDVAARLAELEIKGREHVGRFWYEEKLLKGEIQPIEKRLDMETLKQIVAESESFNDAFEALKKRQPWPDFAGGSGLSIVEYWFDDEGSEKAFIYVEQEQLFYFDAENNRTLLIEH